MNLIPLLKSKLKAKVKSIFGESFNKNTCMSARSLSNGLLECKWELSMSDKSKLFQRGVFCLGIRIFDVTLKSSQEISTCIMKEVQINRNLRKCLIKPPISDGVILIEIGFRAPSSKWEILSSFELKLRERNLVKYYPDDSWFYEPSQEKEENIHQKLYNLSKGLRNGGSERIQSLEETKTN